MSEPTVARLKAVDFPDHTYPLAVAKTWLDSVKVSDALELLKHLRDRFPHILAVRNDLALAFIRAKQRGEAVAELRRTEEEFELLDEETYCRWGTIFKKEADAALMKEDADAGRMNSM